MMNPVSMKNDVMSKGGDIGSVSRDWAGALIGSVAPAAEPEKFSSILASELGKVFASGSEVDKAVTEFNAGAEGASIERTAFLMAKSESEMRMAVQVRNKVVSAYQEVMNLQI
jgi:flagellar hook-basal body complex protein FliE